MFCRRTAFLLLSAVILITGCMIRRGDVLLEKQSPQTLAQKIKVGETTRDDVQKEFGNPTSYSTGANGTQNWIYDYHSHPFLIIHRYDRKTLSIEFDTEGKVADYNLTETHW